MYGHAFQEKNEVNVESSLKAVIDLIGTTIKRESLMIIAILGFRDAISSTYVVLVCV